MVYKYLLPFCRLSFHFVDFFFFFCYSETFLVWCSLTCLVFILLLLLLVSDRKDHCHNQCQRAFPTRLLLGDLQFQVSLSCLLGGRGMPCTYVILTDQGSNPYPLHWEYKSLNHRGSPIFKSLIHFELGFFLWCKIKVQFHSLHMHLVFPAPFTEETIPFTIVCS